MRISFVHDWRPDEEQIMTWEDGLCAAIRVLQDRGHEVTYFSVGKQTKTLPGALFPINLFAEDSDAPERSKLLVEAVKEMNPDVILVWADCTRLNCEMLKDLGKPMAICFAGGDTMGPTTWCFDHFFVESAVYKARFEAMGKSVSTAFGTNTKLFAPDSHQKKLFDVCNFSTYCEWKRHGLLADACKGMRVCTAGFKYKDHETYCWRVCEEAGFLALPHQNPRTLKTLFAASSVCCLPSRASGGSQRTALEAMSMNIPIVVCNDSDKLSEYVIDGNSNFGFVGMTADPNPSSIREAIEAVRTHESNGRSYILSKWTENHYADSLEKGLQSLIK